MLNGDNSQSAFYSQAQKDDFRKYLDTQLAKVDIPDPDWDFLRERILTMYANPLINHLNAIKEQ